MEVYIIRIFRRDDTDPRLIAGIVEEPETLQERVFANIDELLDMLGRIAASSGNKTKCARRPEKMVRLPHASDFEGSSFNSTLTDESETEDELR